MEYRMSFARLWTFWEPPMPTAMADTKWLPIQWNGHHKGQSTNMCPRIGTSFGTLMVLVGALGNKNTWHPEVIGIEVGKRNKIVQAFGFVQCEFLGGLDTSEPWQGRWNGGVLVECVGRAEPPQRNEGLEETKMKTSDLQTHNLTILSSFPYFSYHLDTLHLSLM